jgi:hypothetical protein
MSRSYNSSPYYRLHGNSGQLLLFTDFRKNVTAFQSPSRRSHPFLPVWADMGSNLALHIEYPDLPDFAGSVQETLWIMP